MLAAVRFLARVGTNMHGQCAPLDEAFDAAGVLAMIWPFVGVYSVMPLQIGFPIEALWWHRQRFDSSLPVPTGFMRGGRGERRQKGGGGEGTKAKGINKLTLGQPLGQEHVKGRVG